MSEFPTIRRLGLTGIVVSFAAAMDDLANRAAISFRSAVDAADWPEITETSSTLVSTFLAVDLVEHPFDKLYARLRDMLDRQDWYAAGLPTGRKVWTLPMCFEPDHAPQIEDAAKAAGLSMLAARSALANSRPRVITLGYAPGQPYLGPLSEEWDLPRQTDLTPQVPAGALVVAIRQFVLFTAPMPTGWRHVGQTAFRPFDQQRDVPVVLSPGDDIRFAPITSQELVELEETDSLGGATWERAE